MNWSTPAYKELRLGFEITMHIGQPLSTFA
ncbi:pyrroloquinoline quinone precursor peptide PqqA [Cupriavidus basilensis]